MKSLEKMKKNYLLILPFLLSYILVFAQKGNDYLEKINEEVQKVSNDKQKLKNLSKRELLKFNNTNDSIYFLSNKVILLNYYENDNSRINKFKTALELVRYNYKNYPFIDVNSNYTIAIQLENYSPELSKKFINEAIETEEKSKKKNLLPHLLHSKGKLFFNQKKYDSAYFYFNKALHLFKPDDFLYQSSMYNNFGFIYERQKQYPKAIAQYLKAIEIINKKNNPSEEELDFLVLLKRNLADSYYKNGNLSEAQSLWEFLFNNFKNRTEKKWSSVRIARDLYDLYIKTNNQPQINNIISYVKQYENNYQDEYMGIFLFEMLQDNAYRENNLALTRKYSDSIISLKDKLLEENEKFIEETSNALNKNIVENTNEKYNLIITNHKKRTNWLFSIAFLIGLITIAS